MITEAGPPEELWPPSGVGHAQVWAKAGATSAAGAHAPTSAATTACRKRRIPKSFRGAAIGRRAKQYRGSPRRRRPPQEIFPALETSPESVLFRRAQRDTTSLNVS